MLQEIQSGNHSSRQEDTVAKAAEELQKSKGKSVRVLEWSECDGLLCFQDHIYVLNDLELHHHITLQHHDKRIVGHPGH
jgi:hypothetical protein